MTGLNSFWKEAGWIGRQAILMTGINSDICFEHHSAVGGLAPMIFSSLMFVKVVSCWPLGAPCNFAFWRGHSVFDLCSIRLNSDSAQRWLLHWSQPVGGCILTFPKLRTPWSSVSSFSTLLLDTGKGITNETISSYLISAFFFQLGSHSLAVPSRGHFCYLLGHPLTEYLQIIPLNFRAKGVSLSTATNWAFNWIVGEITPYLQDLIAWRLYPMHGFFCICSFILGLTFHLSLQIETDNLFPFSLFS